MNRRSELLTRVEYLLKQAAPYLKEKGFVDTESVPVDVGVLRDELESAEPVAIAEGRELYWIASKMPPPDEERDQYLYLAPQGAIPEGLHPRTADLVRRFSAALAEKLRAAELKYGYSDEWLDNGWMDECREDLVKHVAKGDPRDVAAYCAFLWHHGERTSAAPTKGGA